MFLGYAKAGIAFLEASGLLMKLAIGASVVAAVIAFYGLWHHEVYESGVKDTIAAIARADAKTVDRARKARAVLKDCEAKGLTWDQSTGRCP
jgi:hypothetical protein